MAVEETGNCCCCSPSKAGSTPKVGMITGTMEEGVGKDGADRTVLTAEGEEFWAAGM